MGAVLLEKTIRPIKSIRVAILGPESSGKSALTRALAKHFSWKFVPEYAREYLPNIRHSYTIQDIEFIAQKQHEWNTEIKDSVVCDTEMITLRIWSLEKFGSVPPMITHLESNQQFDLYLLCRPDIKWEPDPLREHPEDRERLFTLYEERLSILKRPYVIIHSQDEIRLRMAIDAVNGVKKA